jgi:hypothetical protein
LARLIEGHYTFLAMTKDAKAFLSKSLARHAITIYASEEEKLRQVSG